VEGRTSQIKLHRAMNRCRERGLFRDFRVFVDFVVPAAGCRKQFTPPGCPKRKSARPGRSL